MTEHLEFPNTRPGDTGNTGNGNNGFGKRLREVEQEIAGMRADLSNIKENMATKKDISDLRTDIAKQKAEAWSKTGYALLGIVGTTIVSVFVIFAKELIQFFAKGG